MVSAFKELRENNSQAFGTFGDVHSKITDGSKLSIVMQKTFQGSI